MSSKGKNNENGGTGWLRSNYPCNVNAVLYY